jgi:hypothetical protein
LSIPAKPAAMLRLMTITVKEAKEPLTFAKILEVITPALKGKTKDTIRNNAAWYLRDLKKKGPLKAVETKEEK